MRIPSPAGITDGLRPRQRVARLRLADVIWVVCLGLTALILLGYGYYLRSHVANLGAEPVSSDKGRQASAMNLDPYAAEHIFVSYAFYEKDVIQRTNFEFFLQHGWVAPPGTRGSIAWVFVIAGDQCSPCKGAFPITKELSPDTEIGVSKASRVLRSIDDPDDDPDHTGGSWESAPSGRGASGPGPGPTIVLWRHENVGMDLASHNASLEYMKRHGGGLSRYRYFFLLNSSVKGPFYPAYMPTWWHWTHAFLERFQPLPENDRRSNRHPHINVLPPDTPYKTIGRRPSGPGVVRAVGSSLVCLPEVDAGGPGPRLESWALALDVVALELLLAKGVFKVRTCKTCSGADEGIIVGGEYGITSVLLEAGHNVATLMSKYERDVDWRDTRHWGCNDMVHPSRHGTYDGIAFHPYETIFVKSSWHVADPYTRRYSLWMTQHKEGDAGTDGDWNEKLYHYAISMEAQLPNLLEAAYNVEMVRLTMEKQREAEAKKMEEEQRAAGERALSLNM